MKTLVLAGLLGVPLLGATTDGVDVPSLITAYGTAAPFAALCWWQMQRAQKKLDEAERTIGDLQDQAIARERELIGRVAPMFYDGARLYERGNERLAAGPASASDLAELASQVQRLVRRLDER